jgi:glycosyltransferase involved in cell wall biosynthesis
MGRQEVEDELDLSVVLAAFNEEVCIEKELSIVCNALDKAMVNYEVLVVDDGSTDNTPRLVRDFSHSRVSLIQHKSNQGSGSARKTGTLAAKGKYVMWSDVDLTYPNERMSELLNHLRSRDIDQVVGARDSERGTMKLLRVPAKFAIRKLACFLTSTSIPDLNSGMRVFRRDIGLRYIDLLPKGFSCVTTITLAFLCNGHSVEYVPIRYAKRAGKSKFHPIKDTYRYITQVARMVTYFEPLKVFLPISLGMIVLGLVAAGLNLWRTGSMQEMDLVIFMGGFFVGVLGLIADLFVKYQRKLERLITSLPEYGKERQDLPSNSFREY